MRLLYWLLRSMWKMIKIWAKAIVVFIALVTIVSIVHMTNGILDQIDEPIFGGQRQSIEKLPPFIASDFDRQAPEMEAMRNPIIGLYREDHNNNDKMQFHCSAFVISNLYAVTASHCVVDAYGFMTKDSIHIYDADLKDTGLIAVAASMDRRADLAVIMGNFAGFHKLKMDHVTGLMRLPGPFATCGFPWGSTPPLCNLFKPMGPFYEHVKGMGFLLPGMSGGPVIDMNSGMVGAINMALGDGFVIVAPVTGIFGALEIEVRE